MYEFYTTVQLNHVSQNLYLKIKAMTLEILGSKLRDYNSWAVWGILRHYVGIVGNGDAILSRHLNLPNKSEEHRTAWWENRIWWIGYFNVGCLSYGSTGLSLFIPIYLSKYHRSVSCQESFHLVWSSMQILRHKYT